MKSASLIAPSGSCDKKTLNRAKLFLKNLGYNPIYNNNIHSKYLYYAGNYKRRALELNNAFSDKKSKIIFGIKGGMGAIHTLPFLNYKKISKSEKILIGMSDITILLNTIYQKSRTRCIHSSNIGKKVKIHKKTISSLFDAINKKNYSVKFKEIDILYPGKAKAIIVGGNINLLERTLGTNYEIDTNNKILFLEEYDLKEWWVFDMLWQLKLAGKFNNVKGIILGDFIDCGKNIHKYLREFFKDFKCPIIMNQPIGHSEPNLAIPIGEICIIDTKEKKWRIIFNK